MTRLRALTLLVVLALACTGACKSISVGKPRPDYGRPLPDGAPALLPLGPNEPRPDWSGEWSKRAEILPALEHSIFYMRRPVARKFYPQAGIEHETAWLSLERFRELLNESPLGLSFARAIDREFDVYKSAGWDGAGGGVLFTGYCTPILKGALEPSAQFAHPLYALPPDLEKSPDGEIIRWKTVSGRTLPYPNRRVLEASSLLKDKGLELAWLADPLDAYIAHVNGSAFIELPDGTLHRLGYAGKNGRQYVSLGKELIEAGEISREEMSLPAIRAWGRRTDPAKVKEFLDKQDSYVFFQPIDGNPHGCLDVEVTHGRSLATDKSLFPRAALCFVDTQVNGSTKFQQFMLDQDRGGAIRTAGRADIYLGIGPDAENEAGRTQGEGQLYYLFLKPERVAELRASGKYTLPDKDPKWHAEAR
ncbi:MAG: murein transglycosylase [Planctomycetota bacterium]|nr:MAG: murein transglycosylase [Planctomycetota bacterium]